jgi:hypothetical protein
MDQLLARRSGAATAQSRSHRRLARFVDWIKPDPDTREAIHKQAGDIRRIIGNQAVADGLVVAATPEAGSFAKHAGLRRHMRGNSEIEGQDVDLPFVVQSRRRWAGSVTGHTTGRSTYDTALREMDVPAGFSLAT